MTQEIPTELLVLSPYHPVASLPTVTDADVARVKAQGIVTPILARPVVRPDNTTAYEILLGVFGWLSAQKAKLPRVPVELEALSDSAAKLLAHEDMGRVSVKTKTEQAPLADARRLLARLQKDRRLTRSAVAKEQGKTCSALSHELRLMTLPEEVQSLLDKGKLGKGHARALVTLPPTEQLRLAKYVVAQRLTRPRTEQLVRQIKNGAGGMTPPSDTRASDPDVRRLEDEITTQLQCRARLHDGWLSLDYGNNLDVLAGLLERLRITVV